MMETVLPRAWKEQFALAAAIKREDILQRERITRFEAHQRRITAEQAITAKHKEAEAQAFFAEMLAPTARVADFRVRLDTYDTKTVEALMENQETLDLVRKRLDDMLGQAHVLPDGRRVFKTADGAHVFDEHGQAVAEDTISPDMIADGRTKWEAYKAERDEEQRLTQERSQLIEYQDKLDHTRDQLDKGGITTKQLDDMERDLRGSMPDAVRRKVGLEEEGRQAAPSPTAAPASLPDGMDALMQQTGLGRPPLNGPRL